LYFDKVKTEMKMQHESHKKRGNELRCSRRV